MKKTRIFLLILTLLYVFSLFPSALAAEIAPAPELTAPAALLYHPDSDTYLYELQPDQKRYPASITKVTTALIVIEAIEAGDISLYDVVTASHTFEFDLEADGSSQGIRPFEQMTVNDLLHCVLIASANEACNILAEYLCGSVEAFVEKMNEFTASLGCTGTHYTNAHGLHNDEHYTTARDIARIASEGLQHPLFMEIVGTASYVVPATNLTDARVLVNTNMLINGQLNDYYTYEFCLGGKTGRTSKAGNCLVSYAAQDGVTLISVVLGTGYGEIPEHGTSAALSFPETLSLFRWGYENYGYHKIVSTSDMVAEVSVLNGKDADFVVVHPQEEVSHYLPNDFDLSQYRHVVRLSSAEGVQAPVEEGQVLGALDLYLVDQYICSVPVVALNQVLSSNPAENRVLEQSEPETPEAPADPAAEEKGSFHWVRTVAIVVLILAAAFCVLWLLLIVINAIRRAAYRRRKARRVRK